MRFTQPPRPATLVSQLAKFDKDIKGFKYASALTSALETRNPTTVSAVMAALDMRNGLSQALSNRDEGELEDILAFVCRYIPMPAYTKLLTKVAMTLANLYSEGSCSDQVRELFNRLKHVVEEEMGVRRKIRVFQGMLDSLVERRMLDEMEGELDI